MRWKRRTPQIVSFGTMPGFLTRCLHEWSRRGHTVVTPFGLGTVYNETFLDDQLDGLCVFLEDRSQAFYSREHGWETRDDYVTREEQERAAQRSRRRSRAP